MSNSLPPAISELVNRICESIDTFTDAAEIACHVNHEDDVCEVSIFPLTQEVIGGAEDGTQLKPAFSLDLLSVVLAFEHVNSVRWQNAPLAHDDELGNHIVIEGEVEGYQLWMNILGQAPERFETQPVDDLTHRV